MKQKPKSDSPTNTPEPDVVEISPSETDVLSPAANPEEQSIQSTFAGLCPVVGIGASAGGLEALTQMLNHLPVSTGMAFVIVQHLDPNHESMLAELLASHTSMPVRQASQDAQVEPNRIYVIPPNTRISIEQGVLRLTARGDDRRSHLPIDFFLTSLANDQKSRSIGVILSGAASDGTIGLESIKAAGGVTFAQDESARIASMPRNAVAAGVVDFVLAPEGIARELGVISEHFYFGLDRVDSQVQDGPELQRILTLLQSRTGVNFTHYKMPTVHRRLSRRMALNHIQELDRYLEMLEQRPSEVGALFDDLLITVTEFFRDPDTFDVLAEKAFPAMLNKRGSEDTIRIWVAGCASGKEVYSLAICLIEYLEKTKQTFPIQIFGTDVSERSIEIARVAKYPESIVNTVSAERRKRFFIKVEGGYQIARSVRELCIFSRQDVTRDPPLSKIDLISCRNLLIYLGATLQRRVLSIIAYALQPTGCLLLGNSESLGASADHFVAMDSKHKIYCRNLQSIRPHFELPASMSPQTVKISDSPKGDTATIDDASVLDLYADRLMLEDYAPSGFLVNGDGKVVKFRGEVGPYLAPPAGDPVLDVFQLVREDIAFQLRSAFQEAESADVAVRHDRIRVREGDGVREINIIVRPIARSSVARHFLVLFEELSQRPRLLYVPNRTGEKGTSDDYQNLASELSSTRAYMQRLVEELRSANEEAQSTNEELQSTNEELQTAKEELQSSNEELTTTNEEMQSRNRELAQVNNDLINLLSSMEVPIVMLNDALHIRRYTPVAERVLNLIPTDIGRPISDLKPRIDVPDLDQLLAQVIRSVEALDREVQDQNGRWYSLRIHPYRTAENRVEGAVLQLLDIDQLKTSMKELADARDYAEAIVSTVREPLLILDAELRIQTANRAFFDTFGLSENEIQAQKLYDLDHGQWNLPKIAQLFERLAADGKEAVLDIEVEREFERIGWRVFQLSARKIYQSGDAGLILLALEDISDRKRVAEAKYRRLFESAKDGIVIINAETGEITDVNPYLINLFGYPREELIGKEFWKTEPLREMQDAHDALDRLRREEVVRFADVPLKTRDQRRVDVEVVANMYQEGSRSVAQFNIRDITDRKQLDQQMQQTARLESLGILAGGIAHDFNNLLAGILGNAGLALSDAPPESNYQNALRDIVHASQRAADLTGQMLAYAGKGRLVVRRLDMSEVVNDISSLIRSSIPKSVVLHLDLAKSLPVVEADSGQMQQVVMNLIINGAEAIGEGKNGAVDVVTGRAVLTADDIRSSFPSIDLKPGVYVTLEVTDNGKGMDEQTQNRIFDPFFTTKFTGRGLGLASVQGIIKGHQGAIRVRSAPGRGTAFKVWLPAIDEIKLPSQEPVPLEELRGAGELVLVVDDEDIILRMSSSILERMGYRVATAADGKQALDLFRERTGEIDLIILDLTMPVMSGVEALGQIRKIAPEVPVIISSGYDTSRASSEFEDKNVAGFIHKPTPVPEFLAAIRRALRGELIP